MKKLILSALLLSSTAVYAADIPAPVYKAPASTPCTLTNCTGWYVGADLTGVMSNVDIIGQGVNGSVFSGGATLGVHGGYQFWNGQWFAAVEAGVGYQTPNKGATEALGTNRIVGYEIAKVGYGLAGLFGGATSAPTTPSQSPVGVSVPASLAQSLLSPYVYTGAMQRNGQSQSISGVGSEFVLSSGVSLDVRYGYLPAMNSNPGANLVTVGLNRKF